MDKPKKRLPRYNRLTAFETAQIVGGLILFLVLLYEMHTPPTPGSFLNPPLIAAAGLILLWPLRKQRTVQALLLSGGFLLLLWFIVRLSTILIPFVTVYLLAYLFDPIVTALKKRYRVPRWASSMGVTALVLGLFLLFVLLIVPSLVRELETLASRLLNSVTDLRYWLEESVLLQEMQRTGLINKQQLIQELTTTIQQQATNITGSIPRATQQLIGYIGSLLGLITVLAIVPVILYYTLKDYPFIKQRLVELFPTFGGQRDYLVEVGSVMGNYLRGQLTISAIAAFNVSVALLIFDVPFALLIGLLAGILNMIPNLGAILTNIIGVLLAVIFGDPWFWKALTVFLVLIGQGLLEQSILTPKILSSRVGLHPVLILLSLFVFGYFLGIFGFLIAVPTTALIVTFYKTYRKELALDFAKSPRSSLATRVFRRRPQREAVAPDRDNETFSAEEQPEPVRASGVPDRTSEGDASPSVVQPPTPQVEHRESNNP